MLTFEQAKGERRSEICALIGFLRRHQARSPRKQNGKARIPCVPDKNADIRALGRLWFHDQQMRVGLGDRRGGELHLLVFVLVPERHEVFVVIGEWLAGLASGRHPDRVVQVRHIDDLAHRGDGVLLIRRRVGGKVVVATHTDRHAVAGALHGRDAEDQVERRHRGQRLHLARHARAAAGQEAVWHLREQLLASRPL